ncbi:MAG: hypothetical protein QOE35_1695 [Actinomycetota bacterium]|jgi:hypothetical protein
MRLRIGLVIGFALGYYLGSMAGRERYEQINRMVRKVKRSDAYEVATDKARAVVDLGVERAKDVVEDKFGGSGNGESSATAGPYTSSR